MREDPARLIALRMLLIVIFLCLLAGIAAIELRSLDNYFVGDDWEHLTVASTTRSLGDMARWLDPSSLRFLRPVQWLSTLAIYHMFGLTPAPFHALSILLDVASAALLGLLVWRLQKVLRADRQALPALIALSVAVLFLVNPRHHEAVFWHAALNEVWAAFFRLLALNVMLSWLQQERKSRRLYGLGLLAALLAFLSKESAVVLCLDLALLVSFVEHCAGADRRRVLRALAALAPFFALAALWGVAYVVTIPSGVTAQRSGIVAVQGGLWTGILRLIQHVNANWLPVGWLARHAGLLAIEGLGWIAVVILAIRSKRWLWLFASAWTALGVLPYVLTQYGSQTPLDQASLLVVTGDRYLYYSSAGAALLLVESALWLVEAVRDRFPRRVFLAAAGAVCAGVLVVALADLALLAQREAEWDTAGRIADRILTETVSLVPDAGQDTVLCLGDIPRANGNRWVLGYSTGQALALRYGRSHFDLRVACVPAPWDPPLPRLETQGCSSVLYYDAATGHMRAP